MSSLSEKFKVGKVKPGKPHYELFVVGDWNYLDYVSQVTAISEEDFERDDFMLYYISFLKSCVSFSSIDSAAKRFMETDDWRRFFAEDAEDIYEFLPMSEDVIHTITLLRLNFKKDGITYPVKIPKWSSLFRNNEDRDTKVLAAKEAKEALEHRFFKRSAEQHMRIAKKMSERNKRED